MTAATTMRAHAATLGRPLFSNAALGAVVLVALIFFTTLPSLAGSWLPGDRDYAGLRTLESGIMTPMMAAVRWPATSPVGAVLAVVEREMFGESAPAWRVTSLALHAAVVLSLWRLLRWLRMPGCWLAAAIFAVLPLQVDAVATIRNQPILLAALLCVWSALFYFRAMGRGEPAIAAIGGGPIHVFWTRLCDLARRPATLYGAAILLASVAGLTHILAAGLPVAILAVIAGRQGRLTRSDWIRISPIALLSIVLAFVSQWCWPTIHAAMQWKFFSGNMMLQRVDTAGFFVGNCVWPFGRAPIYPGWESNYVVEIFTLLVWIFLMVVAWLTRERIGRWPFVFGGLLLLLVWPIMEIAPWDLRDAMGYFAAMSVGAGLGALIATAPGVSMRGRRAISVAFVVLCAVVFGSHARLYSDAKLIWNDVLARDPDWPQGLNGRAEYELCISRDLEAAQRDFHKLLESQPSSASALLGLARVAQFRGDGNDAQALLYQAAGAAPRDAWILNALAVALERGGDMASAAEEYGKALKLDSSDPVALLGMARLEAAHGDLVGASTALNQSVIANPWFVPGWYNLAIIRAKQDRPEEAIRLFDRACEVEPGASDAWQAIGSFYASTHRYELAVDSLKRALSLDFSNVQAFIELGNVLDLQHDPNCVNCMSQAANLDPETALVDRARALEAKYFPQTVRSPQVAPSSP